MADLADLILPPGSTLLHVGPEKTGTTALQNALHDVRARLPEYGVVYPGWKPKPIQPMGWVARSPKGAEPTAEAAWERYRAELAAARGQRVCISFEYLARIDRELIERTVEMAGGERPHVLTVARRLDKLLPSHWQQKVKYGESRPYGEWLRAVLFGDESDRAWRLIWQKQDALAVADRWASVIGRENVTVLVADEDDRMLLPRVTEALLGLPSGLLTPPQQAGANRSLSYHEAEVVRMVVAEVKKLGITGKEWNRLVKRGLVLGLVASPSPANDPRIPPLPDWAREEVERRSELRIKELSEVDLRVVGDPENLRPQGNPGPSDVAEEPELITRETVRNVVASLVALAAEQR